MKYILIIASLILFGCGGGSNGGSSNGGGSNNNPGDTVSDFKYPYFFNDFDFAVNYFESRHAHRVGDAVLDAQAIRGAAAGAMSVYLGIHTPLVLIDEFKNISRTSCEEGNIKIITYSGTSEDPTFGEFQMSSFSGVGTMTSGSEECPNDFYDGYIKYSFSEQNTSVEYGKDSTTNFPLEGEPFFWGDSSFFSVSTGLLGVVEIERPDPDSNNSMILNTGQNKSIEIFNVETSVDSEYTKGSYVKGDRKKFSNVAISSIEGKDTTTFNADYVREWDEFGETFILLTKINDLVFLNDSGNVLSGTVKHKLKVDGKPDRSVEIDVSFDLESKAAAIVYTREGVTKKNF